MKKRCCNIRLDGLLNIYSYANVGIVLVVYRATVMGGVAGATPESQEVRAFRSKIFPGQAWHSRPLAMRSRTM